MYLNITFRDYLCYHLDKSELKPEKLLFPKLLSEIK